MDAQPIRSLPIACTLDGAGQAERLDQWRRLLARADRRERVEGGLRFQLPATLAGPAAELAAAEQRCCAFFAFTLRLAGGGLELEVRAPTEALPLLTEVFGPARLFCRDARRDGASRPRGQLAILPGTTHYDISARPALAEAVIPFLDAAVCQLVS